MRMGIDAVEARLHSDWSSELSTESLGFVRAVTDSNEALVCKTAKLI